MTKLSFVLYTLAAVAIILSVPAAEYAAHLVGVMMGVE
tara:strand:+ start:121 stop:234 length:114 start_codon:yes stop_codon:yes gene_type:complete